MANSYKASCNCGFQRPVLTGRTKESFQTEAFFPFYCKHCGLISVNTAAPHHLCPKCKSVDIKPYGDKETSIDNKWKVVQCFDYEAPTKGNLCPKCAEFTLRFDLQMIIG